MLFGHDLRPPESMGFTMPLMQLILSKSSSLDYPWHYNYKELLFKYTQNMHYLQRWTGSARKYTQHACITFVPILKWLAFYTAEDDEICKKTSRFVPSKHLLSKNAAHAYKSKWFFFSSHYSIIFLVPKIDTS